MVGDTPVRNTYVTDIMAKSFEKHHLEELPAGEKVRAFYLKLHDTRMMSTLIIFSPEGIVLMGDLTPERQGSISNIGYGLGWFRGRLSENYLCEKFLDQKWEPLSVRESMVDSWEMYNDDEGWEEAEKWCALIHWWDNYGDDRSESDVYDEMHSLGLETDEGVPGHGFLLKEAGWLCAIQQRFSALYSEKVGDHA